MPIMLLYLIILIRCINYLLIKLKKHFIYLGRLHPKKFRINYRLFSNFIKNSNSSDNLHLWYGQ